MKVKDIMTASVVQIGKNEPVAVAARTLAHYNIGALPVCDEKGRLCGIVTDRDIVTRCLAADMEPSKTQVKQVMTAAVKTIDTEADAAEAARGGLDYVIHHGGKALLLDKGAITILPALHTPEEGVQASCSVVIGRYLGIC